MEFTDDLKNKLLEGAIEALKSVAGDMAKDVSSEAASFVEHAAPDLSRYATLYLTHQITWVETEHLLKGLINEFELLALKEGTIAGVKIDETRNALLKFSTSFVAGAVGKMI